MVMPQANDQQLGGHAVTAVGYDDFKECFIVRNSWGEGWGDKGYFYMPYQYISHPMLAQDFWAINWVEGFKNTKVASIRGPSAPDMNVQSRTIQKFGWKPDMPDHRDLHVTFDKVGGTKLYQEEGGGHQGDRGPASAERRLPHFQPGTLGQLHSECLGGCLPLHPAQDDCGER